MKVRTQLVELAEAIQFCTVVRASDLRLNFLLSAMP